MATYASYKKVSGAQFDNSTLDDNRLANTTLNNFGVKWFHGLPCRCSPGCCCNWTVPTGVCRMTIELWGAGGNGSGACSCNRCHHFQAASGGTYNTKSIGTRGGCTYTVCAGGVYRCLSRECTGLANGCTSYVNGYSLSNLCACGGQMAYANTAWTDQCYSDMPYCTSSYCNCGGTCAGNGDFKTWTHGGSFHGQSSFMYPGYACHCWKSNNHSTGGARLTSGMYEQNANYCWIRCGCWIAPIATGGQSAVSNYCGRCCGQGGTGGPGLVKVTYY